MLYDLIGECDRKYNLGLNPIWREQVRMYFRSLLKGGRRRARLELAHRDDEHICSTYERNIMVDHYGVARLCFSTMFPGFPLKKVGDLDQFWQSAEFIRRSMRRCNQFAASATACGARRAPSCRAVRFPSPSLPRRPCRRKALFDYSFTLTPR